jgi:hypothetical protein
MIAIDQSGEQCSNVIMDGSIEALTKPDPAGGIAVLFVNLGPDTSTGRFSLSQLGITSARASGYNVWRGITTTFTGVSATLRAGQTMLVQIQEV